MSLSLSARGERLIANAPLPEYVHEHFARLGHRWDPVSNPNGYISLCIAENKLMWDLLEPRMAECRDVPEEAVGYDTMTGSFRFRRRVAHLMERTFLGRPVDPENLAILAGGGSVLEMLFYVLGDPGDGVLVPTPSYSGFWADIETRDEMRIVPVPTAADGYRLTPAGLDAAMAGAKRPVKALLFTNPDNPLGSVSSAARIEEVLSWAEANRIHVVMNEVYALSVFGDAPFVGIGRLRPTLGDRIHLVWAFSKDFAVSGLRCGVLLSENRKVLQAIDGIAYWAVCSGDTQWLLGRMIADDAWVDGYLATNRARLRRAHAEVSAALAEQGIDHFSAEAGLFLLCDMRPFMADLSWKSEETLWRTMLDQANVNLTPGAACRIDGPGFMRLCFASEATDAAVAGVRRLGPLLQHLRRV